MFILQQVLVGKAEALTGCVDSHYHANDSSCTSLSGMLFPTFTKQQCWPFHIYKYKVYDIYIQISSNLDKNVLSYMFLTNLWGKQ